MKTILIAIGNPHIRFNDNRSAVASYLSTFKIHLEQKGYTVILSDSVFSDGAKKEIATSKPSLIKSVLKKLAPKFYRKLSDKKLVHQIDEQTNQLLNQCKPDLVIEFLDYYAQIGYLFNKAYNTPYVLIYDAPVQQKYIDIYGHKSLINSLLLEREDYSIQHAKHIICYSTPVWNYIQKEFHCSASYDVLPTIVWSRMTGKLKTISSDTLTIGFIGSFLKWHYVDVLVKVFNRLADTYSNINLLLIGYGEESEAVQKLIATLKHQDRIRQTGFISDAEMESLKNTFDIGVMAGSNWYGSPLKIFEYAMLDIPVVGPDSPTVLDLFEKDKELFLVDSSNPEASLYQHLEALINNADLRKQLAGALRTKVENRYSKKYYFSCFDNIIEASLLKN